MSRFTDANLAELSGDLATLDSTQSRLFSVDVLQSAKVEISKECVEAIEVARDYATGVAIYRELRLARERAELSASRTAAAAENARVACDAILKALGDSKVTDMLDDPYELEGHCNDLETVADHYQRIADAEQAVVFACSDRPYALGTLTRVATSLSRDVSSYRHWIRRYAHKSIGS